MGWWQFETMEGQRLEIMNQGTTFDGDYGFTMSISDLGLDKLADGFIARFSGLALYRYDRTK
ncbi:hypothetical protein [Cohnella nanjingensis]|nr:hypothetical protein [Cohnella nanjingensis]